MLTERLICGKMAALKSAGNVFHRTPNVFVRAPGLLATPFFVNPVLSTPVTSPDKRWYRGSNRDTRIRQMKMEKKLKMRLPHRPMVFDKKTFIFQNFDKELHCFQKRLGLEFRNEDYLRAALVHPSFLARVKSEEDTPPFARENKGLLQKLQNLMLLPDRLALHGINQTSLIVTSNVFSAFPSLPSRVIDQISSKLSGRETITRLAENLGIPELLVIEHDIDQIDSEKHLPFSRADVICDAFYALMGAIYHDLGYKELVTFVDDFVMPFIDDEVFRDQIEIRYPKTIASQVAALAGYQEKVEARLLFSTANDVEVPLYVVGVFAGTNQLGEGASHAFHKAEAAAFENAVHSFMWMKESKEDLLASYEQPS